MKYLLLLIPFIFSCKTSHPVKQSPPITVRDTLYIHKVPVVINDTLRVPSEISYIDTTICPVDTVERTIVKTKVVKGEVVTITKTLTDTIVVRITEKVPSIECPEISSNDLLWKIIAGCTSTLFLLVTYFKRKK